MPAGRLGCRMVRGSRLMAAPPWKFATSCRTRVIHLDLTIAERAGEVTALSIDVEQVLLSGYTGRDRAHVLEHIQELERLGIAPPPRVPMVYEVPAELLVCS